MPEQPRWAPWAVITVKGFGRAKSRLGQALPVPERRALARAMFARVLEACAGCAPLHGVLVATDGEDAARLARRRGARVVRDPSGPAQPLERVVDGALDTLRGLGASHALVVMGDLPRLRPRDLRELLAQLRETDVVVAPDALRRGTGALGLRLGLALHSGFGHADSLQRHLREAARIGARCRLIYNPQLAFDLDSPADLARMASRPSPRATPAPGDGALRRPAAAPAR